MPDLVDHVQTGNRDWAARSHDPALPKVPSRRVAVVTCMDARIDAPAAFGLHPGEVHVLRNAGALVTDDVERSVLLSQYALETTAVLVVGHTGCGVLHHDEEATADRIEATRGIRPSIALGTLTSIEDGVRAGVERLRSAALAHRDDVHGFVYDVDTGLLTKVA